MRFQKLLPVFVCLISVLIFLSAGFVASAQWGESVQPHSRIANIKYEKNADSTPSEVITDVRIQLPFLPKGHGFVAWPIKGGSLTAYWYDSYALPDALDQIDYMESVGCNSLSLLVNWYQDTITSTRLYPSATLTVPDEDLETIITYAHQKGMAVALKPHIETTTGDWRGRLAPSDHATWFVNYTAFMQHYAALAERNAVELLVIGTEYRSLTQENQDLQSWVNLADVLRTIYNGKLSYAAHESGVLGHDEGYNVIPAWFWSHFDYAGTTVYYTLSPDKTPSVIALIDAWDTTLNLHGDVAHYVDELMAWQNIHGKPVVFAEVGYRSVDCAAHAPFQVGGSQCPEVFSPVVSNELAQANAYEAFFQVFENIPWLAGVFWWQFEARPVANRECAAAITGDTNFTPCGKLAGKVLGQWYGGDDHQLPADYVPQLPDIDKFEYGAVGQPQFDRVWMGQSSGQVDYHLTTNEYPPDTGSQRSLYISTVVPLSLGRYQQLAYNFGQAQDFSPYNSIELWVKADGINQPPYGGELSVVLIDADNETWQSTRWLDRESGVPETDGWVRVQIALAAAEDIIGNPWDHPQDFIIPEWESAPGNGVLDLNEIRGVWIKSLTTETTPEFIVWVDELQLSMEVVTP